MPIKLNQCLVCKISGGLTVERKIIKHIDKSIKIDVEYYFVTCYNCQTSCLFPIDMFDIKQLMLIFTSVPAGSEYIN
jgi:hypothetical protein